MSVAFSSDDSGLVSRTVSITNEEKQDVCYSIDDIYEIKRCIKWIQTNDFTKIALQFPDGLLADSGAITLKLQEETSKKFFILGDTSYSSCCVDEIAAEHVGCDAIIHFGHACLSPNKRLPVLYVFGKYNIDIPDVVHAFKTLLPDKDCLVAIVYDVMYSYAVGDITGSLKDYKNLITSELEIPNNASTSLIDNDTNLTKITKCHRHFVMPNNQSILDYAMFYIGLQNPTLMNLMLSLNQCKFYSYHPKNKKYQAETLDVNKYLRKRYYYIEKAKDANIIGILVGTLGVSNYLDIIKHLKSLIKCAGKKSYTLVVGKLNAAKLANFAEIEVFVNVACMESSIVDCHEFYQPIVTPYELEIALNQAREWTGDYVTDFGELLPGAARHMHAVHSKEVNGDVSLVTGKMRSFGTAKEELESSETNTMVLRNDMKISVIHSKAAGEFLTQRSWQGLEQKLGKTSVPDIQQGKKGIACQYEDEIQSQDSQT
ncbi:2-(3-amino-3-carboxypropyl)histidine synthase subunit 2-like [Uloborus diversus]|uniref:2-(3-amino-3-carboxypropyl)histidine synthase subunit 2-like n=1 Tax=Uloborus diversus TaxID=327109 RepID=UPI002409EB86|nr:2-(3-amino-3-carboxypropyl)histidine synthase subunit 2-like [Uloborus diversus]XP_054707961.1 2-(3-amino-3-carboxypropyl)histidine synthase subunit 2-like [Uloborus diversus]